MNRQTLDLIKKFEGEILHVYRDAVGLPTMGVGHLLTAEEKQQYRIGQSITREESDSILAKDLGWAEKAVQDFVKVPLTENQRSALISLVFNIGTGNFRKSSCLKFLNQGNYKVAAQRILLWNTAQGKVLKGLINRRAAEKALFEKQ